MLAEPFFWDRSEWIACPPDFKANTQTGKGFDTETGPGRSLWDAVCERMRLSPGTRVEHGTATAAAN
jgi:hypothetical protein